MPALVARRLSPTLNIFADRFVGTRHEKKTIIGAVTRKLAHIIFGVVKSGSSFDQN